MADADFVGQQLVTRNQDGTFGAQPTDELVTWKLKVTRIKMSELVAANVDATAPVIVPAPGAGKFNVLNQYMVLPRVKTGALPSAAGDPWYLKYNGGAPELGYTVNTTNDGVTSVSGAAVGQFNSVDYALADILNKDIVLLASAAPDVYGTIFAHAIANDGQDFVIGDPFEIADDQTGAATATGVVTDVNAGGILGYTITNTFPGFLIGVHNIVATSGIGTLATLDILTVDLTANLADLLVYAWYSEIDTLGY